jgi:hypothetical protein
MVSLASGLRTSGRNVSPSRHKAGGGYVIGGFGILTHQLWLVYSATA